MNAAFRDKVRILVLMLIVGLIFIGFVTINAASSKVQYEINTINKQIQEAERVIQNLEVRIKTASNITNLEEKAVALGMVYPEYDRVVYLDDEAAGIDDFALALMETAYTK